jgi:predicted nuclease with TOPRIM domain
VTKKATFASIEKSIDGLAVIAKKGFDETNEKLDDLVEFKKNAELTLYNMDRKLHTVDQRLDAIEKTLGPLVHVSGFMQKEIRNLNVRISRLEHKAGIK